MTYLFITVAIGLLAAALWIAVKISIARKTKISTLEESLKSAQEEFRQNDEFQGKKEEAQKNADAKKDLLHTGDTAVDFDNSIELLHNANKNKGC